MPAVKRKSNYRQSDMMDEPMTTDSLPEFGQSRMTTSNRPPVWMWVVIFLVIAAAIYWLSNGNYTQSKVYQAVFLSNGQVYFGKVKSLESKFIEVNDVYYVQWQQQPQLQGTTTEAQINDTNSIPVLLKRGGEEHRPFGPMRLNRDQIVAIENVGPDSPVMQQIKQLNAQQ